MAEFSPGSADDANFRAIIERTVVAIFVCVDGIIAFANQAAVRLLGIDEGQTLVGLSMRDFFHKDYAVAMSFGLEGLGSEKDPLLLPMIRRDGRVIDVEIVAAPLAGRLVIEARDVSHARRVEDALRYARDQLEERIEERTRDYARLLRQHEQILNSAAEGIVGLDAEGKITFVNPAAVRMTGWNAWELIGLSAGEKLLRPPGAAEPDGETFAMPGVKANIRTVERTLWRRDGGSFSVEFALAPIEEEGRPVGGVMILRDVAERKRTEEKLRLVAAVFETTAEAIIVLDSSFVISTVNPAYCMITGYTLDEVQGSRPGFLGDEAGQEDLLSIICDAVRGNGRWDREQWNRRKNGEEYAERISVTGITDDVGRIAQYVVVFSDITQRKVDEERIRYQANYDSLTGLPNRTLFMDRLGHDVVMAERTGQRVGLMFLDLDGFKLVNDTFGHDVGDDLLKEAGKRLLFCVRNGDTVARLGGDEFTIIMPNLGEIRNAPMVAQRIIESLEMPFVLKGHEAFISASIGITTFPDDAANVNDLLKYADAAMYRAKDQGKANYQFFTAELNAAADERSAIKSGLSKALERNEFILFYQPKCDLATGRLTGVEALLRWKNPELGLISPVKFIPVLEETGLIGPVGDWVIETACRQYKMWRDRGFPHMRIAVNLSVRQLRQASFAKSVETMLSRIGIEPFGIEMEITESMIMRDTENAVAVLRSLNDMGIHLAMDDFGTGYSSLSYLKLFPIQTIKIDRSFVNDIATDPDDREIVRTIITMGHSLRRRIIAEGVESEAQRQMLRRLRCDEMQGFLLSPPVPAAEIDRLLDTMRFGMEV